MGGIVAADAVDPAHREDIAFADDRNGDGGDVEQRLLSALRRGGLAADGSAGQCGAAGQNGPAVDLIHGIPPSTALLARLVGNVAYHSEKARASAGLEVVRCGSCQSATAGPAPTA